MGIPGTRLTAVGSSGSSATTLYGNGLPCATSAGLEEAANACCFFDFEDPFDIVHVNYGQKVLKRVSIGDNCLPVEGNPTTEIFLQAVAQLALSLNLLLSTFQKRHVDLSRHRWPRSLSLAGPHF